MASEVNSIVDLRRLLLKDFGWLADLYMIDFFVENHWNRLPSSWREAFENLKPFDWYTILNDVQQSNTLKHVLPLSFICFRFLIEMVSLRREEINGLKQFAEICHIENNNFPDCFPSFEKYDGLRIKVKSKKRHEIDRIIHAVEVLRCATSPSFDEVIDIGAGMGHLSRRIAFHFGCSSNPLRVITIEADEELVKKSAKLDFMLTQRKISRRKDKAENKEEVNIEMPKRNVLFMEPGQKLNGIGHQTENTTKCVIGVHTCGDLAISIINEFIADPTARVLLNFGCCYHKLNGGRDKVIMQCWSDEPSSTGMIPNGKGVGFPLSNTYANFSLSYAARELSCHAIEAFQWRLLDERSIGDFRMQCFRSVLEWLIVKASRRKDQSILERNIRHMGLQHVKAGRLASFWDYFKAVLNDKKQLFEDINTMLKEEPLLRIKVDEMLTQWRRILAIYSIRLIVAKLTETIMLEDRRCYLLEQGYNAYLMALFDPRLSARNIALISIK